MLRSLAVLFLSGITLFSCTSTNQPNSGAASQNESPAVNNSETTFSQLQEVDTVKYQCNDGNDIFVIYDNEYSDQENSLSRAFIQINKKNGFTEFKQVSSASGAKYEDDKYIWWTKGTGAFLELKSKQKTICNCDEQVKH